MAEKKKSFDRLKDYELSNVTVGTPYEKPDLIAIGGVSGPGKECNMGPHCYVGINMGEECYTGYTCTRGIGGKPFEPQ